MQRDMQVEVILCPNCEEEVPKTLYCLNCGYPLYKVEGEEEQIEMDEDETVTVEETPEQIEPEPIIEQDTELDVSSIAEEIAEAPLESIVEEVETEEEPQIVSVEEAEEQAETDELAETVEAQDEIEVEAMEVQEPEIVEGDHGVSEVEVIATEEDPLEIIEEEPLEIIEEEPLEIIEEEPLEIIEEEPLEIIEEEPLEIIEEEPLEIIEEDTVEMVEESGEAEEAEVIEEIKEEPVEEEPLKEAQEALVEFEPDPLTMVVMENLLKNISLKVRLVNLLSESDVKEATFNRLFESYAARGERWMNRRNDMLERCRYDLDAMEKAFSEAKTGLEELEIRKAIDDATEEEYQAKAPAFEWDICLLDEELRRRKGEIAYLKDLTRVMPAEEIQKLTEMAEGCYEDLDGLVEAEKVSSETAERVKAALQEALDCLKGSGC